MDSKDTIFPFLQTLLREGHHCQIAVLYMCIQWTFLLSLAILTVFHCMPKNSSVTTILAEIYQYFNTSCQLLIMGSQVSHKMLLEERQLLAYFELLRTSDYFPSIFF